MSPPPGSLHRAPSETDAPFVEPPSPNSQSLVNEAPSRFPGGAPMGKMPISRALLHNLHLSLKVPSKSPLPVPPAGFLWTEMLITRAFLYITFSVPSKGAPSSRLTSQRAHRKINSISRALLQLLEFPLNVHP